MLGEMIPIQVSLGGGMEPVGLVLDGVWKEDKWFTLERACKIVPQVEGGQVIGVGLSPLSGTGDYVGSVDFNSARTLAVIPLDMKGSLYNQYQEAVSELILPKGVMKGRFEKPRG